MTIQSPEYPADYASARHKFRQAAVNLGWHLESFPIASALSGTTELTFDVACSPGGDPERVLVVSSGVHGVEGFFGSAVQTTLLEQWTNSKQPLTKCVFLHGLNPYGFATLRRFDENNVDLNRNFLLPGEHFEGAPDGYSKLNSFLNPSRPPSALEPMRLKALGLIARYGIPALQQAIAGGQYQFPRGLFFGGFGPTQTHRILSEQMPHWLAGSKRVVHLDFHTGLGRRGTCKLLIDYQLSDCQRDWLIQWFGHDAFETSDSSGIAYQARGGFGQWCVSRVLAPDYLYACAEFGTYRPVQVLAGLRAENQAHHWGTDSAASTIRAKARLRELFCPASPTWRSQVIKQSLQLINQAQQGLLAASPNGH